MASSLKDEQDRIRGLLLDTVTLLCRNGLTFKKKLKVQGLLGITLDEENVFIVHFDESLGEVVVDMQDKCSTSTAESDSVRPATANDRTERKSEKKRKATTAELGEPSEKVHIKSEDNDDVVCLEEQPDVKPVPMQALPSYPAEGMYGTYGQLPMSQPPQIMPPVMNANNVSSLPPSVLQTPSSLNTHGLTAYSDGSAITQQMTPEKSAHYTRWTCGRESCYECNYCRNKYKLLSSLKRHQKNQCQGTPKFAPRVPDSQQLTPQVAYTQGAMLRGNVETMQRPFGNFQQVQLVQPNDRAKQQSPGSSTEVQQVESESDDCQQHVQTYPVVSQIFSNVTEIFPNVAQASSLVVGGGADEGASQYKHQLLDLDDDNEEGYT